MPVSKRFLRAITAFAVMLVVSLGMMVAVSGPASAAEIAPSTVSAATTISPTIATVDYGYGIDVNDACQLRWGGIGISGRTDDPGNAYRWYCQRKVGNQTSLEGTASREGVTVTAGTSSQMEIVGGIDMQLYCSVRHPGTVAYVAPDYAPWWNAYNWRCH
jgi:hypothetical protein